MCPFHENWFELSIRTIYQGADIDLIYSREICGWIIHPTDIMDKKSTIIIAAAVVIVAVAAIAFVMLGDSDEKKDYSETSMKTTSTCFSPL